jgi:hypothetical protein
MIKTKSIFIPSIVCLFFGTVFGLNCDAGVIATTYIGAPGDYTDGDRRWEPGFSGSFFDDFTLANTTTIDRAAFYIIDTTPGSQIAHSINFAVRNNSGVNLPGGVIQSEFSLANTISFIGDSGTSNWDILRYEVDITDLTLGAGTYWFEASINGAGGHFIATGPNTVSGLGEPLRDTFGTPYSVFDRDHAWELLDSQQNVVPEPLSITIFSTIAGIAFVRRRRTLSDSCMRTDTDC